MKRKNIESAMIKSIGFDQLKLILEIEFSSGSIRQYFDFPKAKWLKFEDAELQGRFFLNEIQHFYKESIVR